VWGGHSCPPTFLRRPSGCTNPKLKNLFRRGCFLFRPDFRHAGQYTASRRKFLVLRIIRLQIDIGIHQERDPCASDDEQFGRKPDLVVHSRLLERNLRSLVNTHQKKPPRNCVNRLNLNLRSAIIFLINPNPALQLGKDVSVRLRGMETLSGSCIDRINVSAGDLLFPCKAKVIRIDDI